MFNKKVLVLSLILLNFTSICFAECFANCFFQVGTKCVNDNCVSTSTPVPTPTPVATPKPIANSITINAVHIEDIKTQFVNCSEIDLKNFRIYLKTNPPGPVSFYSALYYNYIKDNITIDVYHWAQKDILNRYVFLNLDQIKPQFIGEDFVFDTWENLAYKEILNTLNCEQVSKYLFVFGVSKKGELSDFVGGNFIILNQ